MSWTQTLKNEFFEVLTSKAVSLSNSHSNKYAEFCSYFQRNYFGISQYSLMNNYHFDYFDSGADDLYSNAGESSNNSVNSVFNSGKKTVASVSSTLVQFKWNHYSHRIFAFRQNDPKYMRLR